MILLKLNGVRIFKSLLFSGLDLAAIFESKIRLSNTPILGEYRIFLLAFSSFRSIWTGRANFTRSAFQRLPMRAGIREIFKWQRPVSVYPPTRHRTMIALRKHSLSGGSIPKQLFQPTTIRPSGHESTANLEMIRRDFSGSSGC